MNKNKGFTLIELLVVIAIIGLLATIVLTALTSARQKGADGKIKGGLTQARTQADVFYGANNTYAGICSSANDTANPKGIYAMVLSAAQISGLTSITVNGTGTTTTATCNTNGSDWAAEVPLESTTGVWCVDSAKKSKLETTSIGAGVVCP